jgi:curved DNA-binding protein CbpA
MASESDYYEILGIAVEADQAEIRRAFRERVRACHPDRVANLDAELRQLAEEKMVRLNEAYAVLRNPARRAAYDDRRLRARPPSSTVRTATTPGASPLSPSAPRVDEFVSRDRFAGREFVTRAACEEFETRVKQALGGHAEWTPVALPGTTLAMKATLGRADYYFVLAAPPQLDEKSLRRFLRQIRNWSGKLETRWWGKVRALAFLGAVEFEGRDQLCRIVEQFNRKTLDSETLGPVTMVDLVNWQVFPGQVELDARLSSLLRG